MPRWAAVTALIVLVLPGCTRLVDSPQGRPEPSVAPILARQVHDLLSPNVVTVDGFQFDEVEPERCRAVAREVAPPFLTAHKPVALDSGHWQSESGEVVVEEIVAVYRSDFDPGTAVSEARTIIESCRDEALDVTTVQGRDYRFRVVPSHAAATDSVLWSLRGATWSCDNALVAAHNAAIEITTCGPTGGLDTAALAADALKRIAALADSTM